MILVDSNIPMYLIGAPHPHKLDAQALLEKTLLKGERLVTDAEVLQEILHRYVAIHRISSIPIAFDALLGVVDEIFPIDVTTVRLARDIVLGTPRLTARDAVHLAVMQQHRITRIMSFDADFDHCPGIHRVHR